MSIDSHTAADDPAPASIVGGKHAPALGTAMVRGMAWMSLLAIATRVLSLGTQVVLGWLLTRADYAAYATVVPIATVANAVATGGLHHILVQRGRSYAALAGPVLIASTMLNLLAAGALLCAAPLAAHFWHDRTLAALLAVWAAAIAISAPTNVLQAKLRIDFRFGTFTRLSILSTALHFCTSIALAAMGYGAISFVAPLVMTQAVSVVYFAHAAGGLPRLRRVGGRRLLVLAAGARWTIAIALFGALAGSADYLVVRMMRPALLADYFFGFQLSVAFASLLAVGLQNITSAGFAQIAVDPPRLRAAYAGASRMLVTLTPMAAIAMALATPALVWLIWGGKWDGASLTATIMAVVIPLRLLGHLARSTLAAQGAWRRAAMWQLGEAAAVIVAAVIGCAVGTQWAVSGWVAASSLISLGQWLWLYRELRHGVESSGNVRPLLLPLVWAAAAALVVALVITAAVGPVIPSLRNPLLAFLAVLGFATLYLLLGHRSVMPAMLDLLARFRPTRAA